MARSETFCLWRREPKQELAASQKSWILVCLPCRLSKLTRDGKRKSITTNIANAVLHAVPLSNSACRLKNLQVVKNCASERPFTTVGENGLWFICQQPCSYQKLGYHWESALWIGQLTASYAQGRLCRPLSNRCYQSTSTDRASQRPSSEVFRARKPPQLSSFTFSFSDFYVFLNDLKHLPT